MALSDEEKESIRKKVGKRFDRMMKALYNQQGAQLEISILAEEEVKQFIDTHADALNGSFKQVEMSDAMRSRLERSNWVFSGMKTFHELNESFPSLLDENGQRKPFERFLNDVRSIDETYNGNYLRSEYNFIHASAAMAARWEQFQEDGDRYNLQYRTAGDDRVRPEHAALEGVTLPIDDPFWEEYYPPNGWNCFTSMTPVLTADGWKPIKSIRRGDVVVGGSGNFRRVTGVHTRTVHDELCCIVTEGGSATCTENHRFLTHRGWVSAGSLNPGDIIIQLGKVSAKDVLIQAVRNAHTLLKKALMPLRAQWEAVPPLAVDDKTYRWKKKISHIGPEKFSLLHFDGHARNVGLHDFFGFAERIAERTHALGMLPARSQRTGYTLCSDIWTKKRAGALQLLCNLAYKLAVMLVLSLSHMLAFLGKTVIDGCKAFAGRLSSLFRSDPLRSDGVTPMPDGDVVGAKDAHHGAHIQSPVTAEPPHGALLGGVTELGGIPDVHAFNGFHSFYHFIRSTFCHTNYVLVCGKVTYKKNEEQVYNLSVDIDESYIVPIGIAHNCRCTVVQVRKSKYPATPHDEAMRLGELATGKDTRQMFHFNPGKQQKAVPDYNPYTIRQCRTCPTAKGDGKTTLASGATNNQVCEACKLLQSIKDREKAHIEKNRSLYDILIKDKGYKDVHFDETNGGLKATHIGHNFDKDKGWYETSVQDTGYKYGHSVVLGKETHNIYMKKNCEGLWDGLKFEIAGVENGTPNNIRNALKHCASKPESRIAVLFFPNGNFSSDNFHSGLAKFNGLRKTSQYKQFDLIYCIQGNKIVQIKKPS